MKVNDPGSDDATQPSLDDGLHSSPAMHLPDFLEWSTWSGRIYETDCLTAEGVMVAAWAVNILRNWLGADFLQAVGERKVPHPLLWPMAGLWPENDVPWVYANLIRVACEIALLEPRLAPIRRNRGQLYDTQNWAHAMVQIEVAALALRDGWQVTVEPPLGIKGRGDVTLRSEERAMLVEVVTMGPSDLEQRSTEWFHSLALPILSIELQYGVSIRGELGAAGNGDEAEQWLYAIEQAASQVAAGSPLQQVPGATGGMMVITPAPRSDASGDGSRLAGIGPTTDQWARLVARINDKARQYAGHGSFWLRIEDYSGMWLFTPFGQRSLEDKLALAAKSAREVLVAYPDVCGIILSPGLQIPASAGQTSQRFALDARAFATSVAVPIGRYREALIIGRADGLGHEYAAVSGWYERESTWLDWALAQLHHPPLRALVADR